MKLPNGELIFYIDKLTAMDVYREIYEDDEYFQFGLEINDGDVIFDIGANIGIFSSYIASNFKNVKVYTFEPVPQIFKVLELNMDQFKDEVKVFNIGLSDHEEVREFNYYPRVSADSTAVPVDEDRQIQYYVDNFDKIQEGMPIAKILPKFLHKPVIKAWYRHAYKPRKVSCELKPLSKIINQEGITQIDFLKIDAENFERQVVDGITPDNWSIVSQVAMEVHEHIEGGECLLDEMQALLHQHGFKTHVGNEYFAPGSGVFMLYGKR